MSESSSISARDAVNTRSAVYRSQPRFAESPPDRNPAIPAGSVDGEKRTCERSIERSSTVFGTLTVFDDCCFDFGKFVDGRGADVRSESAGVDRSVSVNRVSPTLIVCALVWGSVTGCQPQGGAGSASSDPYGGYDSYGDGPIIFPDRVKPNAESQVELLDQTLTSLSGSPVKLSDLTKGRRSVVVFTRGWTGAICPYCSTQTSGLISQYAEFKKRNAEVVLVYPIESLKDSPRADAFVAAVKTSSSIAKQDSLPFPVVLDPELRAVDLLGIRKELSKPSAYILDESGKIVFAYVGSTLADRPSAKALLAQLDQLSTGGAEPANPPAAAAPVNDEAPPSGQ